MINTSENRIIFNGNGTATEFPFSFAIINDTDVKVMTVDPDGVETVLDSDYYVDVTASKVIYPGYPPGEEPAESERPPVLPTGWQLVVYRDIPITQEANLGNVWPFNVIEDALDKITMILQTNRDTSDRSLKVSESAPNDVDVVVPIAANMALKWDAHGKKIVLTKDPAEVLPIAENLLQQATQQANIATEQAGIATNKANAAAESAVAAATSEENAASSVIAASNSASAAAASAQEAAEIAGGIGNPVTEVTESNGTVTVEKSDGTQNTFGIVKSVNGVTPTGGNVDITGVPTGTILPFAGNTVPEGFLACNGAEVSRTTYSALYSAIGTTYGSGNGSSTFNLPNAESDKFLQGNSTPGTVKAPGLPNIIASQNPNTISDDGIQGKLDGAFYFKNTTVKGGSAQDANMGTLNGLAFDASRSNPIYGASDTVQPPAVTVRFIIKY